MNTLHSLFDWTLEASLRASLLAVTVVLIQVALRKRIPARWRYALWLPVLLVVVLPVLPESRWSAENIMAVRATVPQPLIMPEAVPMEPVSMAETELPATAKPAINWTDLAALVWAMGAALFLVLGLLSYLSTMRRFRRAATVPEPALLAQIEALCAELRLRVPRVVQAPTIESPAVAGVLHPMLLLPPEFGAAFTAHESALVLKHELMHLKRGDLPVNALICLMQAAHWFNPVLWWAAARVRQDREAACDAQVLASAQEDCRSDYGHALLKAESAFLPRRFCVGLVGIFEQGKALRFRIEAIASYRRSHPAAGVLIAGLMVALTFLGATRAISANPEPGEKKQAVMIDIKVFDLRALAKGSIILTPATQACVVDQPLTKDDPVGVPLGTVANISDEDTRALITNLQQRASGVNTIASPLIAALSGQKVKLDTLQHITIKGNDGKPATLPIGTVCELTPTVKGNRIVVDTDLTHSELLDPVTKEVISSTNSELPAARSLHRSTVLEVKAGRSMLLSLLRPDGDKHKRMLLLLITPRFPRETAAPEPRPATPLAATQEKLNRILLPVVSFRSVPLEEALHTLGNLAREFDTHETDPAKKGVTIKLQQERNPTTATVTLDVKNIPLIEAVHYVTKLTGTKFRVIPNTVIVSKPVPPGAITLRGTAVIREFADLLGVENNNVKAALMAHGIAFPAGSSAGLVGTPPMNLLVNNTEENLDKVDALIDQLGARYQPPKPSAKLVASVPKATQTIEERLNNIVIPRLKFVDARLSEVVEVLQAKGRNSDPAKAVNIVVRMDDIASAPKVSFTLENVTLGDALRKYAELAQQTMRVEPYGVVISRIRPKPILPPLPESKEAARIAKIVIPSVEFKDATMEEALEFLRQQALKHDPDKRGANLVMKGALPAAAKITISLKSVPLLEALRYCTELSGCKIEAGGETVTISPKEAK